MEDNISFVHKYLAIGQSQTKARCEKFALFNVLLKLQKRKLSEHSSDPEFPRALAPQYNKERGKAYLLCSRWVQELLFRYGRYAHIIAKYKPEYRLKQAPKDLHSSNPTL